MFADGVELGMTSKYRVSVHIGGQLDSGGVVIDQIKELHVQ